MSPINHTLPYIFLPRQPLNHTYRSRRHNTTPNRYSRNINLLYTPQALWGCWSIRRILSHIHPFLLLPLPRMTTTPTCDTTRNTHRNIYNNKPLCLLAQLLPCTVHPWYPTPTLTRDPQQPQPRSPLQQPYLLPHRISRKFRRFLRW